MPKPKATKERILDEALAIANAEGLEGLSVREVAKRLRLSPGNVSYHFSRKLDLILGIADRLSAGNSATYEGTSPVTLTELLERFRLVFQRQHDFRGLILSAAHSMEAYPELRARYRGVEKRRHADLRGQVSSLRAAGQLDLDDAAVERLVTHISLTARFWLHDYRMVRYRVALSRVIEHYLAVLADLLWPHATAPGREELTPYLEGFLTEPPPVHEPRARP